MLRLVRKLLDDAPIRRPLHKWDSFLCAENASYLDAIIEAEESKPSSTSVDPNSLSGAVEKSSISRNYPILNHDLKDVDLSIKKKTRIIKNTGTTGDASRLAWFCRSWEEKGHVTAKVDPLNLNDGLLRMPEASKIKVEELEPQFFGFKSEDLDREFIMGFSPKLGGLLGKNMKLTLRTLHEKLKKAYGGSIGYEFFHISDQNCAKWFRDRIETPENFPDYTGFSKSEKLSLFEHLAQGELFEKFLHTKFVGAKRFGLDGGESLIPGMMEMMQRANGQGIEHIIIGMPHRGRLSVLVNICGKPMEALFKEFKGLSINEMQGEGSGDVKYHLGMSNRRVLDNGSEINISLLANPSHLEAVNPLVEGKARAKQYFMNDANHERVMPVQLHGDAAFAGQGVCYETMRLCELDSFKTGGTIHIVVNNQIGFTTDPKKSRSSPYCTDIGHVFGCPIIHVNGDRPEDVVHAFRMAVDFRKKFRKSIIIDLVCYRRFGHNETDEPMFTQPAMYKAIKAHPSILSLYKEQLFRDAILTPGVADKVEHSITDKLRAALANVDVYKIKKSEWFDSYWKNFKKAAHVFAKLYPTKISQEIFSELASTVCKIPSNISLHKSADKILKSRQDSLKKGTSIEWEAAEALAFGSLLNENIHVRISGADIACENKYHARHLVVVDQTSGTKYEPLKELSGGRFTACESPSSTYGVLGFELGFSMENPQSLVMWIAHNADCINSGQIIIDQFLASGESKWGRQCGLVVNVPFGQSPAENAGGRMERFLQAIDEDVYSGYREASHAKINFEVVCPTTPANYFHVLRRQVHRNFRKPLIIFAPKTTTKSDKEEFVDSTFKPVIVKDTNLKQATAKRIVFCCGQISNELQHAASKSKKKDTLVVSIEQLAPFPDTIIKKIVDKHAGAELLWVQEEPKNMGAWQFVEPRFEPITNGIQYVGRPPIAPTFIHKAKQFNEEQKKIISAAFE